MIFLIGADLVLPGRIVSGGTVVIDGGRIVEILERVSRGSARDEHVELDGRLLVPGFIDAHVHGVAGHDVLDAGGASVAAVAKRLPRWGVTAFAPTSVASPPAVLEAFLTEVGALRRQPVAGAARVLPAHLESNFLSQDYRGAQPLEHLRTATADATNGYSGFDILDVIDRHRADVGVVTMAPEIEGGLALVRRLVAAGIHVSIGHTGATFEEAQAGFAAGARRATHLFNAMRPITHRHPGVAGAALANDDVSVELIADGHHVHPAMLRFAIGAKGSERVLGISDGTAASGLPAGSTARLGGRPVVAREVARLEDGTMAGSVATMDRVFATLVTAVGLDFARAAELCATTPAREIGLHGHGVIAPDAVADLVVMTRTCAVEQTWIGGRRVYPEQ